MKRVVAGCLLFLILALVTAGCYASVEKTQVWVDDSFYVTYSFEGVNSTLYQEIKQQTLFNQSSIPQIISNNLKQQELTRVTFYTSELGFNDSSNTIQVSFYMSGSDVISLTINQTTGARTHTVRTDWRDLQLELTPTLSLNFTQYFGEPVDQWQRINYTDTEEKMHVAYYYDYTEPAPFHPQCYFILPTEATNIQAVGDTITFELPPSSGDILLNSPFIILGTLLVVIAVIFLYRRIRK